MEKSKQTRHQRLSQFFRPKHICIASVAAFIIYTLIGFLILPPIVRVALEKKLSPALGRRVTVAKVRLNPLTFSATIEGCEITKKDTSGPFVSFERLYVDLQSISFVKRALVIKSIKITRPKINFARLSKSAYSFSDLIPEPTTPSQDTSAATLFSLSNIEIIDGEICLF